MKEEWRDIPNWEGLYQASDLGQIKSLQRAVENGNGGRIVQERILKPTKDRFGRLFVHLSRHSKVTHITVHKLVLETFVGPRPEGMEGCHNDGNASNNRLSNLRWDTKSGNEQDKIAHGTTNRGSNNGQSKLTASQVLEIRSLAGSAFQKVLAQQFEVSVLTINLIINRKRWIHI